MKLPVIKKLAETHNLETLKMAEEALYEEKALPMEVEGEDECEQLTHILGAIWMKEALAKGKDASVALREYAKKVRDSIS